MNALSGKKAHLSNCTDCNVEGVARSDKTLQFPFAAQTSTVFFSPHFFGFDGLFSLLKSVLFSVKGQLHNQNLQLRRPVTLEVFTIP